MEANNVELKKEDLMQAIDILKDIIMIAKDEHPYDNSMYILGFTGIKGKIYIKHLTQEEYYCLEKAGFNRSGT